MTHDELLDRVPRLTDTFRLIRSKDAGPFMLTIDLFCHDAAAYQRVVASSLLTGEAFADLYGVAPDQVEIHLVEPIHAIKVSFPRPVASGELADSDITGGQQYGPLVELLAASPLGD
ncbi:MAG: hypothetical protein JWO68_1450 [Actinomycetia bacterium]|nr:hypothetical protein [Actinomycetes bacterium]